VKARDHKLGERVDTAAKYNVTDATANPLERYAQRGISGSTGR